MFAAFQKSSWNWMPVSTSRESTGNVINSDAERGASESESTSVAMMSAGVMISPSIEWTEIPLSSDDDEQPSPRGVLEFRKISECDSENLDPAEDRLTVGHAAHANDRVRTSVLDQNSDPSPTEYPDHVELRGQPPLRSSSLVSDCTVDRFCLATGDDDRVPQEELVGDHEKGNDRGDADDELIALRRRCARLIDECEKQKRLTEYYQLLNMEHVGQIERVQKDKESERDTATYKMQAVSDQLCELRARVAHQVDSQESLMKELDNKNSSHAALEAQVREMTDRLKNIEVAENEIVAQHDVTTQTTQFSTEELSEVRHLKLQLADTTRALTLTKKQADTLRHRVRQCTGGMRQQAESMRVSSKALSHVLDMSQNYKNQLDDVTKARKTSELHVMQLKNRVKQIQSEADGNKLKITQYETKAFQLYRAAEQGATLHTPGRRENVSAENSDAFVRALDGVQTLVKRVEDIQSELVMLNLLHTVEVEEWKRKASEEQQAALHDRNDVKTLINAQEKERQKSTRAYATLEALLREREKEIDELRGYLEKAQTSLQAKKSESAEAKHVQYIENKPGQLQSAPTAESGLRSGSTTTFAENAVREENARQEMGINHIENGRNVRENIHMGDNCFPWGLGDARSGENLVEPQTPNLKAAVRLRASESEKDLARMQKENHRLKESLADNQAAQAREEQYRIRLVELMRRLDWTCRRQEATLHHLQTENADLRKSVAIFRTMASKERLLSSSSMSISSKDGDGFQYENTTTDLSHDDASQNSDSNSADHLKTIPESEELTSSRTVTPSSSPQETLAPNTAVVHPFQPATSSLDIMMHQDRCNERNLEQYPFQVTSRKDNPSAKEPPSRNKRNSSSATTSSLECRHAQTASSDRTRLQTAAAQTTNNDVVPKWNPIIKQPAREERRESDSCTTRRRRKKKRAQGRSAEITGAYPIWRQENPNNKFFVDQSERNQSQGSKCADVATCDEDDDVFATPRRTERRKSRLFERPKLGIPMSEQQFERLMKMDAPKRKRASCNDDGYCSSVVSVTEHADPRRHNSDSNGGTTKTPPRAQHNADSGLDGSSSFHGGSARLDTSGRHSRHCYVSYGSATFDAASFDVSGLRQIAWAHGFTDSAEEMKKFIDFLTVKAREFENDPDWRGRHSLGKPADWMKLKQFYES